MKYKIKEGNYKEFGAVWNAGNVIFTFRAKKSDRCAILLYKKGTKGTAERIEIPQSYSIGEVCSVCVLGLNRKLYDYNYEINGKVVTDSYAKRIIGREKWYDLSRKQEKDVLRSGFETVSFPWKEDKHPEIPKSDMLIYKLHVRGFSMDTNGVNRGTFLALQKKIPYFKELGITSLELMPVYEFEEIMYPKEVELPEYIKKKTFRRKKSLIDTKKEEPKVNFWGYGRGSYFAPKASYAFSDNPSYELKKLIYTLHENGIECIMEMFFPKEVPVGEIIDALHYWVLSYHVDGFHLQGEEIPVNAILEDPLLKKTKLFYAWFEEERVAKEEDKNHLFFCNDEFIYPIRHMLCGKDANLYELANQMRKQQKNAGYVNYICDNNGFSLADLFAYSEKHNEANGEQNKDGMNWNYSLNCGVEGETRRRDVLNLRKKLEKNALSVLYLAQGIPLLFSGDEFGNSQNGNNNAYCQDNPIGWVNWNRKASARELLFFVKKLITFRKEHPILTLEEPMQMYDYKNVGVPDLSYHGEEAWLQGFSSASQAVGILYAGKYAKKADGTFDDNIFLALNFHTTKKRLAFPKQEGKKKWYRIMDTARGKEAFLPEAIHENKKEAAIEPQSVVIFIGK